MARSGDALALEAPCASGVGGQAHDVDATRPERLGRGSSAVSVLVAMALFVITIVIGIVNGLDLYEFDRNQLLTHVHSGHARAGSRSASSLGASWLDPRPRIDGWRSPWRS